MALRSSVVLLLAGSAIASPVEKRWSSAASYVGATSSDVFPPTGTAVDTALFPDESQIGYPGPTATGAEPLAIQTAPVYPANSGSNSFFPLVAQNSEGDYSGTIFKKWGNLSPQFAVSSSYYGLEKASPKVPDTCSVTQAHILYRHGARYPTTGGAPAQFAAVVHNATETGLKADGPLEFLNTWTYKLGAELLTPFGRKQNFDLGIAFRQNYGHLLNNFTTQGALPVFRTETQDRMVKTALNFAAGLFGVPEYQDQVSIELMVEATGFNNTGAPYYTCTNANVASKGGIGSSLATAYAATAFKDTAARLQTYVSGLNITTSSVVAMLQMCSYETHALGYSAFCPLFTAEEFEKYEYYFDILFYYANGFGSPVAAAQGLGFLQEFVARFEQHALTSYDSTTNSTLDSNPATFPLNQSIYADATHEVVILDTLTALNLTALFSSGPLPTDKIPDSRSFIASQVVPFASNVVIQVVECSDKTPTKQARFIVNDAVVPIHNSYPGCSKDEDGFCSFENIIKVLKARIAEIDYDHDCFGNYTVTPGVDYNGRAPKN